MNKYFSAALCCGLLLSTGTSSSAGTDLLDQLNKENIIGNDSPNPFIAPEVTPSRHQTPSSLLAPLPPKAKPAPVSETRSRQAAARDAQRAALTQEKLTHLSSQLQTANDKIAALSQALAAVQNEKAALEKAAVAGQSRNDHSEDMLALKKQQSETRAQKLALESLVATLNNASSGAKEKSAALAAQLTQSTDQRTALSKQLADAQNQKKVLEDQLTAIKSSSTGDKQKSVELTEQLNKTTAQASDIAQQLDTLKKQKLELETVLKNERIKADIVASQFEDAKKLIAAQQAQLTVKQTDAGSEKEKTSQLVSKLDAADKEFASLKKQLEEAKAQNASLQQQAQQQDKRVQELTLASQQVKAEAGKDTPATKGVKIDAASGKDTRTSYAVGTWYGDNASREKDKMTSVGKKLDLNAFMQGFNDKVNNKVQLTPDKISSELMDLDKLQKKQFVSTKAENEKQSKILLDKAAKERGAVKTAEGSVYRIVEVGEAPLVTTNSDIITELNEVLGTGKVMSDKEIRATHVKDLPPLYQTVVKKLGLGGVAKIHIPAKQAYGEAGIPGFVPPGTVSVITIKIVGIK
ncbi:FKBP-type peptidyl-prolyl cis-trans isomerase FkpA precursor [compost metagenome]